MNILKRRIMFVTEDEISPFIRTAKNISPDMKDIPYIALALRLNCSIWSNDSRLKMQNKIPVYSTHELIEILKKRKL